MSCNRIRVVVYYDHTPSEYTFMKTSKTSPAKYKFEEDRMIIDVTVKENNIIVVSLPKHQLGLVTGINAKSEDEREDILDLVYETTRALYYKRNFGGPFYDMYKNHELMQKLKEGAELPLIVEIFDETKRAICKMLVPEED